MHAKGNSVSATANRCNSTKKRCINHGSMTFAKKTFAQKDICPERHLPRKTFAQKDICPEDIFSEGHLPRKTFAQKTFAQKDICPEIHLPRNTFAQKDIGPAGNLSRRVFAQKDICPEGNWPRKTFAQKTFAQRDNCPDDISKIYLLPLPTPLSAPPLSSYLSFSFSFKYDCRCRRIIANALDRKYSKCGHIL
jgi:hypothetical protein